MNEEDGGITEIVDWWPWEEGRWWDMILQETILIDNCDEVISH